MNALRAVVSVVGPLFTVARGTKGLNVADEVRPAATKGCHVIGVESTIGNPASQAPMLVSIQKFAPLHGCEMLKETHSPCSPHGTVCLETFAMGGVIGKILSLQALRVVGGVFSVFLLSLLFVFRSIFLPPLTIAMLTLVATEFLRVGRAARTHLSPLAVNILRIPRALLSSRSFRVRLTDSLRMVTTALQEAFNATRVTVFVPRLSLGVLHIELLALFNHAADRAWTWVTTRSALFTSHNDGIVLQSFPMMQVGRLCRV